MIIICDEIQKEAIINLLMESNICLLNDETIFCATTNDQCSTCLHNNIQWIIPKGDA